MKLSRLACVLGGVVCVASAGGLALAQPAPLARRPTQAEAIARVGRVHDLVVRVVPVPPPAKQRNAAGSDEEATPLDTTSSTFKGNCPGGGTFSGTWAASGTASGSAAYSYTVSFTTCAPATSGGDSYDGSVTFTVTVDGTSTSPDAGRPTSTKSYVYKGGVVVVKGATPGKLEVAGLSVRQSPSEVLLDGTTTVDGHVMTFTRERVQ